MLKQLTFISLLTISSLGFAQEYDWLLYSNLDWDQFPDLIEYTEKKQLVDSIIDAGFYNVQKRDWVYRDFHFIDVNGDLNTDIVFNGFTSSEARQCIILLNLQNGYDILFECFGTVSGMSFKNGIIEKLIINDYSCCDGIIDHMEMYKFDHLFNEFDLVENVAYHKFFPKPDEFSIQIPFEVQNEVYRMRGRPEIENEDSSSDGNVLAEFHENANGIALAESVDDTGRIWWYVIMDKHSKVSNSMFHEGNNNSELPYRKAGWMSSRYLIKKNN